MYCTRTEEQFTAMSTEVQKYSRRQFPLKCHEIKALVLEDVSLL